MWQQIEEENSRTNLATTEHLKIKEQLAALEAEINKQKTIEILSQILSGYLRQDGKRAPLKTDTAMPMERISAQKKGKKKKKKTPVTPQ